MTDSAEIERLKDAVVAAAETYRDWLVKINPGMSPELWPAPTGVQSAVDALRAARRPLLCVWKGCDGAWRVGHDSLRVIAAFHGLTAEADARAYAASKESQG